MTTTRRHPVDTRARRILAAAIAFVAVVAAVEATVRLWRVRRDWFVRAGSPVADSELADHVRSALGVLVRSLDVPRVHVMAERGVVVLHGDVPDADVEAALVDAAAKVPGVEGVVSKLHRGLLEGDSRPSAARVEPSLARRQLVDAAVRHGGGEITAERAVAAVLAALAAELGPTVTARVRSHVAEDVAVLLDPSPTGRVPGADDDTGIFYERIAAAGAMPERHIPWVATGVLTALRALVPDDADAIEGALSPALAHLWAASCTATGA
jgi:uncharacterized protein (DUF2267 family)